MKVIYIAGPFRGANTWEIEQNIRRAETLALAVWRAGGVAICPHTNTRFFQGAAPDSIWLEGCLALMYRCDGVIFTPDYKQSSGALEEERCAKIVKMRRFYYEHDKITTCTIDLPHSLIIYLG